MKSWKNMKDPVCPLVLSLYGHPDSGGYWEQHCTEALKSVGFQEISPDCWRSIFFHPKLKTVLAVYVDDFKMADYACGLPRHGSCYVTRGSSWIRQSLSATSWDVGPIKITLGEVNKFKQQMQWQEG